MAELNTAQWLEVKQLFERAADLPAEQQRKFLGRECADEEVRREVASLLEHAGGLPTVGQAIAEVADAVATEQDPDQRLIGTRLGAYRVEAIAGHGGMGAVYRAERDDAEFRQRVAIKLVRAAAASPAALARFKQERQILARLSHPNIARLLDGGSTPEGVPYLVMEYIEGEPVTVWCERQMLKLDDRLRLFVRICEGVEHAHRRLIVHRDLKPANILVTADGTPKLLDFGIAKLLDASADAEAVTKTGLQLMTPDYTSPEQVRGDPVTPAADVYSLGLILYELLTGAKAQRIRECSAATIAQVVCLEEPRAPASLRPELAGDPDSIIRMALRKEPERRYGSGGELGQDLQRHLDGQPVRARPDTLAYRSAKFVRRNRAAVAAVLGILASVAAGLTFALAARRGAEKRLPRASQVTQLTQIGTVDINAGVATDGERVYFAVRKGGRRWLAQVAVNGGIPQPLSASETLVEPWVMALSPDRSRLLAGVGESGTDQPLWEVPIAGGSPRRIGNLVGHAGTWSRDGSQVVFSRAAALYIANRDGTGCRELLPTPGFSADSIRWAPRPGPDILRFVGVDSEMQPVALWEVRADGAGLHRLLGDRKTGTGYPDDEWDGAWIPSGKYYLFQSWLGYESAHGRVTSIWALREGRSLWPSSDKSPVQIYSTPMDFFTLAPHPDGTRVFFAAGQALRELMLYNRKLRQFLPFLPGIAGRSVSYAKDKLWVAYTTYPDNILWRSRPDGSEAMRLTPVSWAAVAPQWSPDGTRIAFLGFQPGEHTMGYVVPAAGGKPQPIPGSDYPASSPSWSPDGKSLVFNCIPFVGSSRNRGVFITGVASPSPRLLPGSEEMWDPAWSPNGRYIAASRDRQHLMLFDLRTEQWAELADGTGVRTPFWSHDGGYVYYQETFGGMDQPIWRVNIRTRKIERMMGLQQIPQSNASGYVFAGMAPDDAPVASVIRSNSDIYALDLNLP